MKTLTLQRTFGMVALIAAALGTSSINAQKTSESATRGRNQFYSLKSLNSVQGLDVQTQGGEVVGVTVRQEGTSIPLRIQTTPMCPADCAAGEKLTSWEDEGQTFNVSLCGRQVLAVVVRPDSVLK
jgi:hypothetical protein